MDNQEPNIPFYLSFNKLGRNNEDFSQNVKKTKAVLYIMIPIFCIFGIVAIIWGSVSRSLACTYNNNAAYDCRIISNNIFTGNNTKNYSNIRGVTLASQRGSQSTMYQIQLVDNKGNQLSYTNTWESPATSLRKKVDELNKYFNSNKNFSYDFGVEWILICMGLAFIIVPFIILAVFKHYTDNYIFEKVRPGYYKAVLKAKGIGKMNLNEEQMKTILHQSLEGGQKTPEQVYEESWNKKDQAFKDKDVEDLTKQFYEDEK